MTSETPEKFDPHTASVHADSAEMLFPHETQIAGANPKFREPEGERAFYQIEEDDFGADQMLLARMLKGIMPVADVIVKIEAGVPTYYSYEIPLENVNNTKTKEENVDRIKLDAWILEIVFHDEEHAHHEGYRLWNMANKGDNFYLFDFDVIGMHFWGPTFIETVNEETFEGLTSQDFEFLTNQLSELLGRFDGSEGLRFINDILENIQKVGGEMPAVIMKAPGDNKVGAFQQEVVRRLRIFEHFARLAYGRPKEEKEIAESSPNQLD